MNDYDELIINDGKGKLLPGDVRSASYLYHPGATTIHLESKTEAYDGTTNQVDFAEDICRIWVIEGRIANSGGFEPSAAPIDGGEATA